MMLAYVLWGVLTMLPLQHVSTGSCAPWGNDGKFARTPCELWQSGSAQFYHILHVGTWRHGSPHGPIVAIDV